MIEIVKNPYELEKIGKIAWSPSRLECKLTCDRKYYLNYIHSPRVEVPSPFFFVRGIFLHKKMENFFKKDGKPRNKSAESFANAAKATFRHYIKTGEIRGGQKIDWLGKNPYVIRSQITTLCEKVYPMLVEEGPPLMTEQEFSFILDGRCFKGVIDAIYPGMIIRDYKTGSMNPGQSKLDHMPQFTIYALAFTLLCCSDDNFRKAAGLDESFVERWQRDELFISKDITLQYFKLHYYKRKRVVDEKKKKIEVIEELPYYLETHRNDGHYKELCELIDEQTEEISEMKRKKKYIPSRGEHCDYCQYKEPCNKMGLGTGPLLTEAEKIQLTLPFDDKPEQLMVVEKYSPPPTIEIKQKTFRFPTKKYIDTDLTRRSNKSSDDVEDNKK